MINCKGMGYDIEALSVCSAVCIRRKGAVRPLRRIGVEVKHLAARVPRFVVCRSKCKGGMLVISKSQQSARKHPYFATWTCKDSNI